MSIFKVLEEGLKTDSDADSITASPTDADDSKLPEVLTQSEFMPQSREGDLI